MVRVTRLFNSLRLIIGRKGNRKGESFIATFVGPKLFLPDLRSAAMRKSTSLVSNRSTGPSSKENLAKSAPFHRNSATDIDFSSAHAESLLSMCERHKGGATGRWLQRGWLIVRRCTSEWRRSSGGRGGKRGKTRQPEKDEGAAKGGEKGKENATSMSWMIAP